MSINWEKCFGFDLETHGDKQEYALQPFRTLSGLAKIKSAAIANSKGNSQGVLWPEDERLRNFFSMVKEKDGYVVGWNVAFDAAWCIAAGLEAEAFAVKWLDGMLLWRHAVVEPEGEDVPQNKRKSYSLESAMKEYYPDHADFKEFADFQANDQVSLNKLLHRNKEDARWTLKLAHKFWHMLTQKQQRAALIEARCIPLMAKTRVMGILSSKEEAHALSEKLRVEAIDLYNLLLSTSPEVEGLNLGSPKQLRNLIYTLWGLPATRFSKKTNDPSTDKYALFDLAALDERAALLKKLREAKNNRTKYAEGTLKSLAYNGDGFVRPQAKIFSTYTSRITYGSSDRATVEVEKTTKKEGTILVTKQADVPVGVALHQWKRGKEYRRLLKAPPGFGIAELDAAGQEFRWMAVASKDETMLSLCAPGEDAHSYMGSRIVECDYRELIKLNKAGDAQAGVDRKCGKFCIAEGQLVLTDKGLVPIEKVLLAHRVWDGVEWVRHEGLIYQGEKEVMTYAGLTATPDHEVYLQDGRKLRFDQAATQGSRLARGGRGGETVRFMDSDFKAGGEALPRRASSTCQMSLREGVGCSYPESSERKVEDVQTMYVSGEAREDRTCCDKWGCCSAGAEEVQCYAAAVREPKRSIIQELWSQRDSVQICLGCRSYFLCLGDATSPDIPECGHRQRGQRGTLRAGKPKACEPYTEHRESTSDEVLRRTKRTENSSQACIPCTENFISSCEVHRARCDEPCISRADSYRDQRQMGVAKLQTKRVYDLANAGPRHRFTVSDTVLSNCNLSYQYRVSPKTATVKARVEYEMDVDEFFIVESLNKYKLSYPGVEQYWGSQIQKCRSLGYAETFAGRRVQLNGSWRGKTKWPMESTAINYPIQGTGGDQKYLALAVARNMLAEFGGYFYYELHDGLFFIFPEDKLIKASIKFCEALSNLPYKQAWRIDLPIKFPFDCKIGPSWGELKDLEKFL